MNHLVVISKAAFLVLLAGVLLTIGLPPQDASASLLEVSGTRSAVGSRAHNPLTLTILPRKLSLTNSGGSLPTIVKTDDGNVVVAWQQNVPLGLTVQQEIFARSSSDGINFNPQVNVSNTKTNSREPNLFDGDGGKAHLLYEDMSKGATRWQIMNSDWVSGTWSSPLRLTTQTNWTYQDPVGVQASDGTFWFATQTYFGSGTWTDALVQQVGGSGLFYNLSKDGSAVRRPAIAAGDGGQIFVGWLDHANEKPGIKQGFKVRRWNGSLWSSLPDASSEGYNGFPALAYSNGLLYAAWPSAVGTAGIKERTWNGSAWSSILLLRQGSGARYLKMAVTAKGNIFIAWDKGGVVYLQENTSPPVVVSNGVPKGQQPSLYVDQNEVAYVAFQNGAIWYATVP